MRWPVRIAGQLGYLVDNMSASAGAAPTAQQRDVGVVLERQGRTAKSSLDTLVQKDLAALNALLKARGLKPIEVTLPPIVF